MARDADTLSEYNARRDFSRTAEPRGKAPRRRSGALQFVVQKHAARRLHYDFRLEWNGVLLSWAVTRGPSADPAEKRLAVRTEDHPLSYAGFEGTIPAGQYGGGTVMLWDRGTWEPEGDVDAGLAAGKLTFTLRGTRMKGGWSLVRMRQTKGRRENWLLVKQRDDFAQEAPDALTESAGNSVETGRGMDEIASGAVVHRAAPATGRRCGRRPAFREPQLATLVDAAPEGEDWLHETKFDGYRCLAALGRGGTRLYTRSGRDWTERFAALGGAFDSLACDSALIDGEVMAAQIRGSAFSSLQNALAEGGGLVFFAFDLIERDGTDLAALPQRDRRRQLEALFAPVPAEGPLRLSEIIRGSGPEVFAAACQAGAEGIISKRADAPYRGRRSRAWRKVKCDRRQEFVIGGYTPSDRPGRPFASLLLGTREGGRLVYRGRVGTGFNETSFRLLAAGFTPRKTAPFDTPVPGSVGRGAVWLRPDRVAEIGFAEFTADGHLRHARYLGLREDKEAGCVTLERPAGESEENAKVGGVTVTSPDRVVYPDCGVTKHDVAEYYHRIGARMMRIAAHRPVALLRCPGGLREECFFQKHAGQGFPAALRRLDPEALGGDAASWIYMTRPEALVAAAQMGTIEVHIGGVRIDRPDRPDRLVFDLDPDEAVGWAAVRRAARDLSERLAALGLRSFPLVTGGKGVHVCVALRRSHSWETVKLFARTVAHVLAASEPDRFTANMSKSRRKGRIFVDWLRNDDSATAVCAYSLRARAGARVAVPLTWRELDDVAGASAFGINEALDRLDGPCPWLEALDDLQSITAESVERLDAWSAGSPGG